jgi:hypothetical protein
LLGLLCQKMTRGLPCFQSYGWPWPIRPSYLKLSPASFDKIWLAKQFFNFKNQIIQPHLLPHIPLGRGTTKKLQVGTKNYKSSLLTPPRMLACILFAYCSPLLAMTWICLMCIWWPSISRHAFATHDNVLTPRDTMNTWKHMHVSYHNMIPSS